jgi:hypothetical protein
MLGVRAMREVEARHIHSGFQQPGDHFLILAGWTDRGNNLCLAFPT